MVNKRTVQQLTTLTFQLNWKVCVLRGPNQTLAVFGFETMLLRIVLLSEKVDNKRFKGELQDRQKTRKGPHKVNFELGRCLLLAYIVHLINSVSVTIHFHVYVRQVLLQQTHHCFGVVHPRRGALEVLPDGAVVGKRQVVALQ
jgi:hypothetical protein